MIFVFSNFQITTLPDEFPAAHAIVNDLRLEYVVAVEGVVRLRPSESVNKKMKTGFVEVSMLGVVLYLILTRDIKFFYFILLIKKIDIQDIYEIYLALDIWFLMQVAAEHVRVLNSVKLKLPFLVTTADDAKDIAKEEIRLR